MNATKQTAIPDGYMKNATGHLVPVEQVREHDKLRDAVAADLASDAVKLNAMLAAFKHKALGDIADLIAVAAERYDVKIGGEKGNVQITTYDGQYKVVRSCAEQIAFTEELEAAKELINRCIERWSEGANANINALVDRAFRTNAQGKIKTTAVLDLLRLDIDDNEWTRAMEALKDSIQTTGTSVYVRIYQRIGQTDKYAPVPLDLAAV